MEEEGARPSCGDLRWYISGKAQDGSYTTHYYRTSVTTATALTPGELQWVASFENSLGSLPAPDRLPGSSGEPLDDSHGWVLPVVLSLVGAALVIAIFLWYRRMHVE